MKSAFWRATALLMALALVLPAAAFAGGQAGEVSHSALMGSTLINTSAQLNTWTHWAKHYGNYTEIDTQDLGAGNGERPQGTLIWDYDGDNTLLFRVRDMDLGTQNSTFMFGSGAPMLAPFLQTDAGGYNAATDGQMINLALARELTNGAFSVGAFYGDNGQKNNESNAEMDSKIFGGQFSWGNGQDLDVAVSFTHGSTINNNGTDELKDTGNVFDAYARYTHNQWIYQFGGFYAKATDETSTTNSDDYKTLGGLVNAGQLIKDDADGQVSVEFYFKYMMDKQEPGAGGEIKDTNIYFPGLRSACTQMVSDHFGILLGGEAYYTFMGNTDDTTTPNTDISTKGMTFAWNGGIFWENDNGFRVSGEFGGAQYNLDQAFSVGNDQPLVSRLEATYKF